LLKTVPGCRFQVPGFKFQVTGCTKTWNLELETAKSSGLTERNLFLMDETNANGIYGKSAVIDVGKMIDDTYLNKVSISVILLCGLIMIMDGYDYTIITVAAPAIMKEWNIGTKPFGWVFSAAFFGYLIGATVFGILSDRIGRKKTLILGGCVFSVGTLLVYFSHSLESLIAMRVFAGIGIGGAVPCAITLTSEYSPLKGRGKYVSVMYSGFLIGIVFGGFIAGFMLRSIGWRPLFLVGFFAPIIALIVLALKLPESARWLAARYGTPKERESLVYLVREMQPGIQIDEATQFVSAGSNKENASVKELFAGKLAWVTPVIWALYLISSIAVFFIGSWAPQILVVKGFSASAAAFITGTNGILVAVGCLLSGFYFDKVGFRWGVLLYVIASACVVFMGGLAPAGFVALLFISSFFINSGHMDVTILAPIVYPPGCRNKGAGTAIAVARIGAIIGPPIGGMLLATELPMTTLMGLVSIPLLISAVLCYIAGRQYDFYFAPLYSGKITAERK
jgi:MFS transporter, AAHS family, 4-hydroxybenzoate transporter